MLKLGETNTKLYLGDRAVKKAYFGEQLVYETGTIPEDIPSTLNECSWNLISQLSKTGEFSEYFSVGDTKSILLNGPIGKGLIADNLAIDLVVVGINHNAEVEGNNLVHFLLGLKNGNLTCLTDGSGAASEPGYFAMNVPATNVGGWDSCQLKSIIIPELKAALPPELRAVLRKARKWTDNVGGGHDYSSNMTETVEELCLIDEFENAGYIQYGNSYQKDHQKRYEYFKSITSPTKYVTITNSTSRVYFRGPSPYQGKTVSWSGTVSNGSLDWLTCNGRWGIPVLLFV